MIAGRTTLTQPDKGDDDKDIKAMFHSVSCVIGGYDGEEDPEKMMTQIMMATNCDGEKILGKINLLVFKPILCFSIKSSFP